MPSTFTPNLRLEDQANAENIGQWGDKVDKVVRLIEEALTQSATINTTGGTTTLTVVNGDTDQARKAVIRVAGVLTSNAIIVVPNVMKTYWVSNETSGAFTVSVKTAAGSGQPLITQGSVAALFVDGANGVMYISPQVVRSTGAPSSATGVAASSVSVVASGNLSSTNAQSALVELQGDIDTLNASVAGKQAADTDLTAIAAISPAKGTMLVGNGTSWVALAVGTNGQSIIADSAQAAGVRYGVAAFPSGTAMLFIQTAAPTGWTKSVVHNNKALRIVSGAAGSGGTQPFTTAFANKSVTGSVSGHALTIAEMPSHDHSGASNILTLNPTGTVGAVFSTVGDGGDPFNLVLNAQGGGAAHTHTFSGTAIDLTVQYVDAIIATKD